MKEIAANDFYEISIDNRKNRLYLTVKGFWKELSQVPNYLVDLKKAGENLEPGFTIVTDLRTMKLPATTVASLHVQAQKLLVDLGLDRTAEVVGEAILLELQLKRYAEQSAMSKAEFNTKEEAEAWLDAKS